MYSARDFRGGAFFQSALAAAAIAATTFFCIGELSGAGNRVAAWTPATAAAEDAGASLRFAVAAPPPTQAPEKAVPHPERVRLEALLEVVDPGRPAEYRRTLATAIIDEAGRYDFDPLLIAAMIYIESRFDPRARSPKGAFGLMQLLPATAAEVQRRLDLTRENPREVPVNIALGTGYYHWIRKRFPNDYLALTAYNVGVAGTRRLLRAHGRVPKPYDRYARRVLSVRDRFAKGVHPTLLASIR